MDFNFDSSGTSRSYVSLAKNTFSTAPLRRSITVEIQSSGTTLEFQNFSIKNVKNTFEQGFALCQNSQDFFGQRQISREHLTISRRTYEQKTNCCTFPV
ncbi:hypothetical protein [Pseudomonas fluorescens]|uniref:hypothetical protein n=1 Tax=Pseudomonas fluorescens TaxID=294 RepID=UPI001398CFE2|nr:hypothetical protein [Pseudomonas fluorescens]QIA03536.1 hypothetical protein GZH78_15775 [Pseudomonas fluorescens]